MLLFGKVLASVHWILRSSKKIPCGSSGEKCQWIIVKAWRKAGSGRGLLLNNTLAHFAQGSQM